MASVNSNPSLWSILCGWFGLKLLLSYCYFSTDFEVHRNWLAITYNLPISKWYLENTSIWTLDYPPFFAWFERGLSQMAGFALLNSTDSFPVPSGSPLGIRPEPIDSSMIDESTLIFQRLTVIASDLIFVVSSLHCVRFIFSDGNIALPTNRKESGRYVLNLLLCCNLGLLLVDNIHFQYNGFLFGFLLFSVTYVGKQRFLLAAFLFAILLNLKHIFLYLAPAYAAYFFRNYCFVSSEEKKRTERISFWNVIKLAFIGAIVFGVSFGPFIYLNQLQEVFHRLFPFKRGLTHAYWAPNFWALYNAADYGLMNIRKGFIDNSDGIPGYATGLVQEFDHIILPNIKPIITFLITIISMAPACIIIGMKKMKWKWEGLVCLLTLCAFSSFLFGWHVHEKAILMILIPLNLLTIMDDRYAKIWLILNVSGGFSLFPLLFEQFETPIKYTLFLIYIFGSFWGFQWIYKIPMGKWIWPKLPLLNGLESIYVLGFFPLELICIIWDYHPRLSTKLQFVPLMVTSIYCAIGVLYCWIRLYWTLLCKQLNIDKRILMKKWRKERQVLKRNLRLDDVELWRDGLNEEHLRFVGGLDVSTPIGDDVNAIGCLVILTFPELKLVHSICEHVTIDQPYVPGYLAFREGPVMIELVKRLECERPDLIPKLLYIDGNGLLHPDRFGLACHIGVLLDIPTIGIAKDLHLVHGIIRPCKDALQHKGSIVKLMDENGEILGAAVNAANTSKNPIYISIGHRINLDTAIKLTILCSKYRIPEPIRLADKISRERVRTDLS